jgi:hypothetical protein
MSCLFLEFPRFRTWHVCNPIRGANLVAPPRNDVNGSCLFELEDGKDRKDGYQRKKDRNSGDQRL